MHIKSAIAAALLSTVAVASPVEILDLEARNADADAANGAPAFRVKKTFTVKQQKAGSKPVVLAPAIAIANTYAKFGIKASSKVKKAAESAQQSGSVIAVPQAFDIAYLSPVLVGGQQMTLNFDTGSSDLWVFSTLQPSNQTQGRTLYDNKKSSNAVALSGHTWNIGYGDGSGASGKVFADTVVIGGVTATSMAVEAATSVSQQFQEDPQSMGLVGLAFSNLNTVRPTQQKTFFDMVKPSLVSPVFTAKLVRGGPGSYDFGFVNSSKYQGSITYAPIKASTGFWQFTMGGYRIAGQKRVLTSMGDAIADTGTSLMYLPDNVVQTYWNSVPGAYNSNSIGGYIYPCSVTLPRFSLGIRGTLFAVPGSYLNYAPLSSPMTKNTMCFGGLQSNSGIGFSILGDVFLKAVFVIFDQTQSSPRIGFAKQA